MFITYSSLEEYFSVLKKIKPEVVVGQTTSSADGGSLECKHKYQFIYENTVHQISINFTIGQYSLLKGMIDTSGLSTFEVCEEEVKTQIARGEDWGGSHDRQKVLTNLLYAIKLKTFIKSHTQAIASSVVIQGYLTDDDGEVPARMDSKVIQERTEEWKRGYKPS